MNTLQWIMMAGSLLLGMSWAHANPKVNGAISFQGDTVHLELTGQQNWDYDVKRLDNKGQTIVEMTVPALDDATAQRLEAFTSDFVKSVQVNRQGPDGKHVVSFVLSGENIETFDYLTDQPSRLIMDFYVSPTGKSDASKTVAAASTPKDLKKQAKAKTPVAVATRKPAASDALTIAGGGPPLAQIDQVVRSGIFDGGDPEYDRFAVKNYEVKEEAVIKAQDNYYIPFPMLEVPVGYWEKLKLAPVIYEISPKSTDENKQARLLLTLFNKQRYAVFLKTREWFKQKYPQSEYNEVIDFMTADVRWSLWEESRRIQDYEEAIQGYKETIEKYPKSPLAERTSLKLGYYILNRGDFLRALRAFNEHIDNKAFGEKSSLSKDLARLGMGLAFMKLNKWNEALEQFAEVEKTSTNRDMKVEAAYRRGDVWGRAKDYGKAVEEYKQAIKKYPEGESYYPNASYNQAESLFWMKNYNQSLNAYRDFIKKFPGNEHVAFAMTRLGELMEIFGVDQTRVMGAYLETYFRSGESPNAVIARLRLLSARMKGMKPKEVQSAVDEIMSLAKKVDLPNIEQFATVMVADGYKHRDEYQKAIDLLSKYYKEHPTSVDIPLMTNRIVSNITDKIQAEVEKGDFISALKTHGQYADNWLKNSQRLDAKYNVGRAFEMAGVPVEAEKYYKEVLNRVYALRGTPEGNAIRVKEELPADDELNLRLASVYAQEQKYNQAYEYLKNVKNPEKLSEATQIERVNIAVGLLEKRGDTESAIRYLGELLRTWKGQPELVAEPYLKLAELQLKQGRRPEALQALQMLDQLQTDSGKVPPALHAKALEMIGDMQLEDGKTDQAMASYDKLLQSYEQSRPLSSIRYKLGQIYFKKGEVQKAAEIWNELKGDKNGFWKNLAQEQLKNSEWRDDYKKYIKRIPAMSETEKGQ